MSTTHSRRGFLGAAGSLPVAAATKASLSARSTSRVLGANDRINIGSIGVGGMGTGHLKSFVAQSEREKDIQMVAVCDVFTKRAERARSLARLAEKDVYRDYRELLARGDIDCVVIATPDHWHARMAIDALAAGKDVYLQKPMTLTVDEARDVAAATARYQRVLQVGSQGLSDPRVKVARDLIAAGAIGELLWAQGTSSRNSVEGEWNYRIDPDGNPETIDWDRWLGPAPRRPFSAERYFRWRKYWDYSGGIATDLFYHTLGPILSSMGARFPVRVTASGGIYVQRDREVPDTYATLIEYPEYYISLSGSMANAAGGKYHRTVIYGHKGTILMDANAVTVVPEVLEARRGGKGEITRADQAKSYPTPPVSNPHRAHTDNFFACMRSRKQPNLHAELGYQIMTAIKLGVDSYRYGRVMFFDERQRKVVSKPPLARPAYEGKGAVS